MNAITQADIRTWPSAPVGDDPSVLNLHSDRSEFLLVVPPVGPNQKASLARLFERLHNMQYTRWCGSRQSEDINPMSNYDLVAGRLNEANHLDSMQPYGDVGIQKLQPYSFFSSNIGALRGMLGKQPLIWSIDSVSPDIAIKKIEKVARMGAEGAMREAAARLKEQGINLDSVLIDMEQYVPGTTEELEKILTDKEDVESVLYDMMRACLLLDRTKKKLDDAFEDNCIINGQIAQIYAENGWPRVKIWKRDQVSWWGPPNLENADQASVWATHQMVPLHQAVVADGAQMQKAGNYRLFLDLMKNVARNQPLATVYKDGTLTQPLHPGDGYNTQDMLGQGLGYNYGYGQYYRGGANPMVLEQTISAKLINLAPVKLTLSGKALTDEQRTDYDTGTLEAAPAVLIEGVEQSEYDDNKGNSGYKTIPVVERWDSKRYGDRTLVYYRKGNLQLRKRHDPVNVSHNFVARFGTDTSLVTKGIPFHELYHNVMMQTRKVVSLSGMRTLTYDLSEMPDGYDLQRVMYEAKESGIIVFNGKRIGGSATKESYRHLQSVDLSVMGDALALINLSTLIRQMYDDLCGVTAGLKGQFQSREALGQTQLSMSQGSLITQKLFAEHEQFVEDVLDKMMRLGQRLWSRNEMRRVILGENFVKTLQLTEDLDQVDMGLFVTSSSKTAEERQIIISVANQALSSGAVGLKDMLKLLRSENPFKMLELLDSGLDAYEKQRSGAMQQQAQASQLQAEASMARSEAPVKAADVTGRWRLEVEKARQYFETERASRDIQFKEEKSDLDAQGQVANQMIQQAGQQQLVAMQQPAEEQTQPVA